MILVRAFVVLKPNGLIYPQLRTSAKLLTIMPTNFWQPTTVSYFIHAHWIANTSKDSCELYTHFLCYFLTLQFTVNEDYIFLF